MGKYEAMKKQFLANGGIFDDKDFPPTFMSLFPSGKMPGSMGNYSRRDITWKRPKQLNENPKFMEDKTSRFDIDQGLLGDCWFLTAAGSLSTANKKYLEKVMPMDQSFEPGQYTGMFRFNFWWYGDWKEIIIDDYIPCIYEQPMFSNNKQHPNEFWPCLLEKAYAKLRGGYWNMDGGIIGDAMVDMTGGVSEMMQNNELNVDLLKKAFAMETLLGAGCNLQRNGLQPGHAYLISGLKDITLPGGQTVQLIRCRNPWGDGHEWSGPWSDKSAEMNSLTPALKAELGFENKEDGEFWMTISDYRSHFAETHFCHVHPDTILEELEDNDRKLKWNVKAHQDRWVRGVSAGGWEQSSSSFWQNPQYFVTLKDPDCKLCDNGHCTLIASLLEKQLTKSGSQIAKGFFVFQIKGDSLGKRHVDRNNILNIDTKGKSFEFSYGREVTQRFELLPGTYVIIPTTQNQGEEADFLLRVFTENHTECGSPDKGDHEHDHEKEKERKPKKKPEKKPTVVPTEVPTEVPTGETTEEWGEYDGEDDWGEDDWGDDYEDGYDDFNYEDASFGPEAFSFRSGRPLAKKPVAKDHIYEAFEQHKGDDGKMYPSDLAHFLDDLYHTELGVDVKSDLEACRTLVMNNNDRGYLSFLEAKAVWEEIRLLKVAFTKYDKDKSKTIDSMELRAFLKNLLKFDVSRDLWTPVVRRYGGRDNQITFPDFLMLYMKLKTFAGMYKLAPTKEEFLTMSMFV